jgi:cell division protein FtsL
MKTQQEEMSKHLNGKVLLQKLFFLVLLCSVLFVSGCIILCKADLFKVNCPRFR